MLWNLAITVHIFIEYFTKYVLHARKRILSIIIFHFHLHEHRYALIECNSTILLFQYFIYLFKSNTIERHQIRYGKDQKRWIEFGRRQYVILTATMHLKTLTVICYNKKRCICALRDMKKKKERVKMKHIFSLKHHTKFLWKIMNSALSSYL